MSLDAVLEIRLRGIMQRESRDWHSEKSGATLHKIGPETAARVASLLLAAARQHDVPLAYAMGAVCQESRFDPGAMNPNGFPGVVERTDWGLGQISGRNLVAMGVPPETALSPEWSAPATCARLRDLLNWVKVRFQSSDPFYVAAMAYNRGRTGAEIILTRRPRKGIRGYETLLQVLAQEIKGRLHAGKVMVWTRKFRDELGLASP